MFKFRKVASILASAAMLSSTVALAAATTFPAPFVQNGVGDVALVWGSHPQVGATDLTAVTNIVSSLSLALSQQGGSQATTTTITGEAYELFSTSSRLYMNDPINNVRTGSITDNALPTVLADGNFDGDVTTDYQQTILLGAYPKLKFQSQPETGVDPELGYELSTTSTNYLYNMTVTFDQAVNFSDTDSEGQTLEMFGKEFTVSSDSDADTLVLLKSAQAIDLDSDNPTQTVTVGGEQYTIELRSASDTSATIKVTNAAGTSQTKEVTEDSGTKTIAGLSVAVTDADETNFKLSATITVGAEEMTFEDAQPVSVDIDGDDEDIDGTLVDIAGTVGAMTKLTVSVYAAESDEDAILVGGEFMDPVFGSFKVDFPQMSLGDNSSDREMISVQNSGNDQMSFTITDHNGEEKTVDFVYNSSTRMMLAGDDDGHNMTVREENRVYLNSWVILPGAEGRGHLVELTKLQNDSDNYGQDEVEFTDVFTGETQGITPSSEGTGALSLEGDDYTVRYYGADGSDSTTRYVKVNFDRGSTAAGGMILYPTLATDGGALVAVYEPQTSVLLNDWNGRTTELTDIFIPTGDSDTYYDVDFTMDGFEGGYIVEGTNSNGTSNADVGVTVGELTFNFTWVAANTTSVHLLRPDTGVKVTQPALIIWEGEDEANNFEALIVTLEPGTTSDDGIGVNDVIGTWDSWVTPVELDSNEDLATTWDYWGSIITTDQSSDDQTTLEISYPNEQVSAMVYLAEASATIGGDGGELGSVIFKDSETTSFQGKNLIVVGGSCVNTVAAKLLDSTATAPICGPDWTTKTGSDAGSFIIQTFESPYTTSKIATLVAGYNAGDTTNAATYFRTQGANYDIAAGKKYKGTTETSATLQTS